MSSYSVAEAKNQLPRLLDRMLEGEEVTITRRGEPIARLVPPRGRPAVLDVQDIKRRRIMPEGGPSDAVAVMEEVRGGYRY